MSLWKISFFFQFFLVTFVFSAIIRRQLPESLGLYDSNDEVEELTADNFDQNIYGSKRAWLVEFYNTFCGRCRNYAPTYKTIAQYFKNFKDVFIIAAVDCSKDKNVNLCRDFEIFSYPDMRYFHENYVKGVTNLGTKVEKSSVTDVEGNIRSFVNVIIEEQKNKRGMHIPPMSPYDSSDVSGLFNGKLRNYTIVVFENSTSMFGIEAIINYHNVPMTSIKYSTNDGLMSNLDVHRLPQLIIYKHRILELQTSLNPIQQIDDYFMNEGINTNLFKPDIEIIQTNDTKIEQIDKQPLIDRIKLMGDTVFLADLETALYYSLRKEVVKTKNIEGEKLAAFKYYLQVINKYFPLNENGKKLIKNLTSLTNKDSINGGEIYAIMKEAENVPNLWSGKIEWLRCIASVPDLRGYTCGLWTMFHFLTVAAADNQENPREVLDAMHGYIKNFFGCGDCSQHFQQMAIDRKLTRVSSGRESILWLWAGHNEVNKRIAGNPTEDPQFPKQQFPVDKMCPKCKYAFQLPNSTWNKKEVEKYLRHIYSIDNVRKMDSASLLEIDLEDFPIKNAVMGFIHLIPKMLLIFTTYLGYINAC